MRGEEEREAMRESRVMSCEGKSAEKASPHSVDACREDLKEQTMDRFKQ